MKPSSLAQLQVSLQTLKAFISYTPSAGSTKSSSSNEETETITKKSKKLSPLEKLHSFIIPPLPLTPRDSQQLLDDLTGSFRRQLAASSTPPKHDNYGVKGVEELPKASSWKIVSQPLDRHVDLLLRQNKLKGLQLESEGSSNGSYTRIKRILTNPVAFFEEHVWSGTATLELANFVLRTYVNQLLQATGSPPTTSPPKEDGALVLLYLLRTSGLVPKTGPPTGNRTLTNWLTAGLLLSSNPSIPFSWILFSLQDGSRNQAGALLWTVIQSYKKIYDEKRAVELYLNIIGHKDNIPHTKTTRRINTKIMFSLQAELTTDATAQSQILYKIARRIYERYTATDVTRDIAEAVQIWNPAPHDPALTAHLALEHFQDPYPGLDFLLNSLPDASYHNLMVAENYNHYYEHSMLGLRVAEAFLRKEQPELAGEALRVVKQRLLLQNTKEARAVLKKIPEEKVDLVSWLTVFANRAKNDSARRGMWDGPSAFGSSLS